MFNQYRNSQVLFVLSPYDEKKNVTEIDYRNKNRKKMWYINDKLGYVFYS